MKTTLTETPASQVERHFKSCLGIGFHLVSGAACQRFRSLFQLKDHTFRGHGGSVDQLCWHPKHTDQVVSASSDKTVRLWDARTSKAVATIPTKGQLGCAEQK